jgi:hypothetical protein
MYVHTTLHMKFRLDFRIVPNVWYFFDFHSIALKEYDLQWFIQIGCQIEEFVETIFFSAIM